MNDLQKNELVTITIDDIGADGEGIGRINNFAVFVPGGVPGDTLTVKLLKLKKNYGFGKLVSIVKPSPIRTKPLCGVFGRCGGCTLQHIEYDAQLELKTKKVSEALKRIGGFEDVSVNKTVGMANPFNYRNKAQFPVRESDGAVTVGFYAKRSHNIISSDSCVINKAVNSEIIERVKEYLTENKIKPYDETTHKGLVRHIMTKIGFETNEIMVCIVINGKKLPYPERLIEKLKSIESMTSIAVNYNTERTNVILGEETAIIRGKQYITDYIGSLKFEISPLSFYQVNPVQTKILYETALKFCNLTGSETVIDLFCGIGTISLFLAQKAEMVYGIEIVDAAVCDAKRNARINNIDNVNFIAGDVSRETLRLYTEQNVKADVIVMDPPRKGCDEDVLNTVIDMEPQRIVYISCDPATLARDLKILAGGGYEIKEVQPVDMFCMTAHVECVVLMSRKD